jgi:hypothetical protein
MEGPREDPTIESLELLNQVTSLIQAPLDRTLVFRLTLFLYSHVTEMRDLYDIPMNMLRIIAGERCSAAPFADQPRCKVPAGSPSSEKIMQLAGAAEASGWPEVAKLYTYFFVRQVRNAFFHSDYALDSTAFNMKHGDPSASTTFNGARCRTIGSFHVWRPVLIRL